jgi:hypothetical protein
MSGLGISYPPPSENLPIFDSSVFNVNNTPLTISEGLKYFLAFPSAQGTENLQTINVSGLATFDNNVDINTGIIVNGGTTGSQSALLQFPSTFPSSSTGGTNGTGIYWNATGAGGETDIICYGQGGVGGLCIYIANSSNPPFLVAGFFKSAISLNTTINLNSYISNPSLSFSGDIQPTLQNGYGTFFQTAGLPFFGYNNNGAFTSTQLITTASLANYANKTTSNTYSAGTIQTFPTIQTTGYSYSPNQGTPDSTLLPSGNGTFYSNGGTPYYSFNNAGTINTKQLALQTQTILVSQQLGGSGPTNTFTFLFPSYIGNSINFAIYPQAVANAPVNISTGNVLNTTNGNGFVITGNMIYQQYTYQSYPTTFGYIPLVISINNITLVSLTPNINVTNGTFVLTLIVTALGGATFGRLLLNAIAYNY